MAKKRHATEQIISKLREAKVKLAKELKISFRAVLTQIGQSGDCPLANLSEGLVYSVVGSRGKCLGIVSRPLAKKPLSKPSHMTFARLRRGAVRTPE